MICRSKSSLRSADGRRHPVDDLALLELGVVRQDYQMASMRFAGDARQESTSRRRCLSQFRRLAAVASDGDDEETHAVVLRLCGLFDGVGEVPVKVAVGDAAEVDYKDGGLRRSPLKTVGDGGSIAADVTNVPDGRCDTVVVRRDDKVVCDVICDVICSGGDEVSSVGEDVGREAVGEVDADGRRVADDFRGRFHRWYVHFETCQLFVAVVETGRHLTDELQGGDLVLRRPVVRNKLRWWQLENDITRASKTCASCDERDTSK